MVEGGSCPMTVSFYEEGRREAEINEIIHAMTPQI